MWIKIETRTRELRLPWMDEPVQFNRTGTAQVPADVGERLVDEVEAITKKQTEDS